MALSKGLCAFEWHAKEQDEQQHRDKDQHPAVWPVDPTESEGYLFVLHILYRIYI
jgi:hypothetical protein